MRIPGVSLIVSLSLIFSVAGCGRRQNLAVQSDRTSNSELSTNEIGETSSLRCQVIPLTTEIAVPVDANGNLAPGYLPPPVGFNVIGTVEGVPATVQIPPGYLPPAGFSLTSSPTVLPNRSLQFEMRPTSLGVLPVAFPIVSSVGDMTTCQTSLTVTGTHTTALSVTITANGVTDGVPILSGQSVTINWASNGTGCTLKLDGVTLPAFTGAYGELRSSPLVNSTSVPVQKIFQATCTGGNPVETKSASVAVTVSPAPSPSPTPTPTSTPSPTPGTSPSPTPLPTTTPVPAAPKWYPAVRVYCPTFCGAKHLTNVPSPDGARCASGEQIPPSSVGKLTFPYGAYPNTSPHYTPGNFSVSLRCVGPGKLPHSLPTAWTVGCFCG